MKSYVIAIDGGATKTLGILYDLSGQEIKRSVKGFASFSVDEVQSIQHIYEVIEALIEPIDLSQLAMIQAGIAGYSNLQNKEGLLKEIQEQYQCPVSIVTDAEIALYSIKKDQKKKVLMVLGGTGSVVMYEDQGQVKFIGGFGHLLGDEGSGYHLAITALKRIINQFEEREKISPLSKSILNEIGASNYSKIKDFVYNHQKTEIASLSQFIAKHAIEGDQEAINLFIEEGRLLANQTLKAIDAMGDHGGFLIGFKGGFLLNAPYVKKTLIDILNKNKINYKIDMSSVEPVLGAYYLAKRHIDKR